MDWNEYVSNHSNIMRNCANSGKVESVIKDYSEIDRSKKRGNFILRQELKNWTIKCSLRFSMIFNFILLFIFFSFGFYISVSSGKVTEYVIQYDGW
jgi:hypothetical protein